MVKASSSICRTQHPPGHLALNLIFGPVSIGIANTGGHDQSCRIVCVTSHTDAFSGRFIPQHLGQIIIDVVSHFWINLAAYGHGGRNRVTNLQFTGQPSTFSTSCRHFSSRRRQRYNEASRHNKSYGLSPLR
jgi:hypothetical protein